MEVQPVCGRRYECDAFGVSIEFVTGKFFDVYFNLLGVFLFCCVVEYMNCRWMYNIIIEWCSKMKEKVQ